MAKKFIFFWVFVFLSNPVCSQLDEFNFNGFKQVGNNISLNGIAEIEKNGILKLTNDTSRLLGHAFYPNPIKFKNSTNGKAFSFSTVFAFAIVPEYAKLGGHGLAFTISSTKELEGSLPSQYLGLLNATDNGNFSNHVFAVEFDTVQDFEFQDISDNHVGIDINSLISNVSVNASYFLEGNSTQQKLNLKSGKTIQAWIDYDSMTNLLNVTLSLSSSKPISSILSFPVDLSPIFKDFMYLGFSSSTGLLASSHYVFGWSFKMNGQARSLDLSSLPSLPGPKKKHTALIIGVSVSAVALVIFAIAMALYLINKIKNMDVIEAWELDIGPHRFSYKELKKATKGFRDKGLLGFGGFGKVYKGTLPYSNTQVAVKRISHESKQGLREFASEIASIGRLRHRNLVQLLGWCRRREDLLLVYDFMPNGSLDKYIYDVPKMILTWEQRFKIIKGVASGLLYLHEEWEQTVIHRDVKAGNVLLDAELNGRLGDFGLAKLYEHGSNPATTRVVGTLGYLAPELTRTGKPTTSSDVFAFGALLLEVVCGRRPIEQKALPEELILVDWVWDRWKEGGILEVVDPKLRGEYDEIEVVVVLKLGLMCSNNAPTMRPSMKQVVSLFSLVLLMKQLNPQTIMAPNFSPGGGRVDYDFGFAFNDSNFSDRILKIEIIPDISDAKSDPESFNAIAEWAHNRKRRREDVKKENVVDAVTHHEEQILSCNMPDTEEGVTYENQDEDAVAMIEESPSNGLLNLNQPGDDGTHGNDAAWSMDCSTVVRVKTIHISSPILAAKSPFFYKLFSNGMRESEQRHVTIQIHGSEEAALMDLLNFMYSNTLSTTTPSALLDVLMAADKFEVTSCMRYCSRLLRNIPMTCESALLYLDLPSSVLMADAVHPLTDAAKQFLAVRYKDISKFQEEVLNLPLAGIEAVLSSDDLQVASEDVVYDFVLKWARIHYTKLEERRDVLGKRLGRLVRFPYMTCRKLKKVLTCSDFDPELASKVVLEALFFKAEAPYRQRSLAAGETSVTMSRRFVEREYKYRPVKVVEFELPRRQCVVYLDLKREECVNLFPAGRVYSQAFHLGGQGFFLSAHCNMDQQSSFHCFGLFLGMQEKGSVSFAVDYEFAARSKPFEEYQSKYKGNYTFTGGKAVGYRNLFAIPWTAFLAEDSAYFINGVLHLRAELTIKQ